MTADTKEALRLAGKIVDAALLHGDHKSREILLAVQIATAIIIRIVARPEDADATLDTVLDGIRDSFNQEYTKP